MFRTNLNDKCHEVICTHILLMKHEKCFKMSLSFSLSVMKCKSTGSLVATF